MSNDPLAVQLYRAIGRRVAAARAASSPRLTQEELSTRTGSALSRSAVANIENGRQRVAVHHLYHLARALELEPADLLPPASEVGATSIMQDRRIRSDASAAEFTRLVLGDQITSSDAGTP